MPPATPLTTVTAFNTHLTILLETLADLDRDIANLSYHQLTHPTLLSAPSSSLLLFHHLFFLPVLIAFPATSTPNPSAKVKVLRATFRDIPACLKEFEKALQGAEMRASELKEKYYRTNETNQALKDVFKQVFEGVEICRRGFAELKGWWVGVIREGAGLGAWRVFRSSLHVFGCR